MSKWIKKRVRIVEETRRVLGSRLTRATVVVLDDQGFLAKVRLCQCCDAVIDCQLPPRKRVELYFPPSYHALGGGRICEKCESTLKEGRTRFYRPQVYQTKGGLMRLTAYGQRLGPEEPQDEVARVFRKLRKF